MKYRYLSTVALLVAALTTLATVIAFGTASVTPNTSMAVVNTSYALLALIPDDTPGGDNVANQTATAEFTDWLEIDLTAGYGGPGFGYQPGSSYTHDKIFKVQNNDNRPKNVSVTIADVDPLSGVYMKVTAISADGLTSADLANTDPLAPPAVPVTVQPNTYVFISITVTVSIDAMPEPFWPVITFHAQ